MTPTPILQQLIDDAVKAAMCIALREQYRNRLMALMHEVNWVRRQLGENPHRCENCGHEMK